MSGPNGTPGGLIGYAGVCETCGKLCFTSRRAGRAVRRSMHDQLSVYRCGEYWHVGHLPDAVVHGRITRDQLGTHNAPTAGVRIYQPVPNRPKYWPGQPTPTREETSR